MKKVLEIFAVLSVFCLLFVFASDVRAQGRNQETFTGTIVSFGSGLNTRTVTTNFTLTINNQTSDQQAQRFLGTLQESGQDSLLREISKENLGFFSVGAQVGRRINVVRESVVDGRRRIFVVFERWM